MNKLILIALVMFILAAFFPIAEPYSNRFLYPTRDRYCENRGLEKAYSPQLCENDGYYDYYSLCRCRDKRHGKCQICWPRFNLRKHQKELIKRIKKAERQGQL
tara:strand:- start:3303 stop:3611 length:309 start_codon:yes stop_codon:yes gene_type:complete